MKCDEIRDLFPDVLTGEMRRGGAGRAGNPHRRLPVLRATNCAA